jgi:cell division septum initiation protein DivIVA
MTSRIEQIIEEIEEYIDGCNYSPLSKKNIVVNKEEIEELLRELRMKTPDEIKRYQKILANKDAILADAQAKADAIVNQANIQLNELISEQEIMKQAYAQANAVVEAATMQAQEILNSAAADANEIRMGAMQYTDGMLAHMQRIIQNTM